MKKSCSGKKSKLIRNGSNDIALNESEEVGRGLANDEQIDVNKTSAESGVDDENTGRLEKKSANNLISTSVKEKFQRTSPRLGKVSSAKAAKWVENSFETKSPKNDSELCKNQVKKGNSVVSAKDASQEFRVISTPTSAKNKKEVANCKVNQLLKDNCISPKSSRTPQCLKIHAEDKSKDEWSASTPCCNSKCESPNSISGKKRASFSQKDIDSVKKIKMEETTTTNNTNNNNHSDIHNGNNDSSNNNDDNVDKMTLDGENMLKIELEMEKRRKSATFNIRDIKTIVAESEFRNKKWKETFLKYKCPARWGIPIVKNCSEKWDGKQIPQKLLNRYQKYLLSNNLKHPIFLPENSEYKHEESFIENELAESQKQTSTSDGGGMRMTLRNRNQQKPPVIEDDFLKSLDEEFLEDNSDDWMTKQKSGKKHRNNMKNKKNLMLNNQQLVLKLERCTINKKYARSDSTTNEDDAQENYSFNAEDQNHKAECQVDTMVCPICSLRFPKQQIESHATECASKTFKD